MPRMTQPEQLRALRRVIAAWRGHNTITLYILSRETGVSVRRCEALVKKYHLDVRRTSRETKDVLSEQYCDTIDRMRTWCGERAANFRMSVVAALNEFMRRRARY